jgi:N-acetylmuramoyl-L-alanine amidase
MDRMEQILAFTERNKIGIPLSEWNTRSPLVVLLDPGHGGMVNGKYTTAPAKMSKFVDFEFYEGVFNRAIMWLVAGILFHAGGSYSILVPEDEDISLEKRVNRARTVAKLRAGDGFKFYYHSIHANAFGTDKANGIEVWTSPGETKSDQLATIYYQALSILGWNMRSDMGDGDVDKEEQFYVLKNTPMPALLTETGFYTNFVEVQKMLKLSTIQKIAELMVEAHFDILKLKLL